MRRARFAVWCSVAVGAFGVGCRTDRPPPGSAPSLHQTSEGLGGSPGSPESSGGRMETGSVLPSAYIFDPGTGGAGAADAGH